MTAPVTVTIGDVIDAIGESLAARKRERKAREKGEGYDWGYFGYEYHKAIQGADAAAESTLNTYIDQRIAGRTGETK